MSSVNDFVDPVAPIGPDLRAHIKAHPVEGAPGEMRAAFARLAGPQPHLQSVTMGGVPCVVAGKGAAKTIWLHGGGYVFGGPESHGNTITYLAERLGHAVVMPCYRRAPEAIWPAPLYDAVRVLDAMDGAVGVVGDSAGGHLALQVAFRRPGAVRRLALIGANTDRTGLSRTRGANSETDVMNDDKTDKALWRLAMPSVAMDCADASPLSGPLHNLPPLWLTCAANEVLADDTLLLARAAALAGTAVDLHVERDLFHMWTLWPGHLPEARRTLDRIAAWMEPEAALDVGPE